MIQGCFQTNWRRCFFPEACISFYSDPLNKNLTFLNNLYVQSAMLALYLLLEGSVCPIVQRDLWDVGFERPLGGLLVSGRVCTEVAKMAGTSPSIGWVVQGRIADMIDGAPWWEVPAA